MATESDNGNESLISKLALLISLIALFWVLSDWAYQYVGGVGVIGILVNVFGIPPELIATVAKIGYWILRVGVLVVAGRIFHLTWRRHRESHKEQITTTSDEVKIGEELRNIHSKLDKIIVGSRLRRRLPTTRRSVAKRKPYR